MSALSDAIGVLDHHGFTTLSSELDDEVAGKLADIRARLTTSETERNQAERGLVKAIDAVRAAEAQRDVLKLAMEDDWSWKEKAIRAEARVEALSEARSILRAAVWSISLGDVASDAVTATCLQALEAADAL